MPERIPICPTCNLTMETGVTVGLSPVKWVAGEPAVYGSGAPLPILTYRCPNCGYLASYARAHTP
jgi:hypothetical protein